MIGQRDVKGARCEKREVLALTVPQWGFLRYAYVGIEAEHLVNSVKVR